MKAIGTPPDGYLLFSDPNANTIYRWSREGAVSVYRSNSGYSGFDIGRTASRARTGSRSTGTAS